MHFQFKCNYAFFAYYSPLKRTITFKRLVFFCLQTKIQTLKLPLHIFPAFQVGEAGEHGEPPGQQGKRPVVRLHAVRDGHHQRRSPALQGQRQRQSTGEDRKQDRCGCNALASRAFALHFARTFALWKSCDLLVRNRTPYLWIAVNKLHFCDQLLRLLMAHNYRKLQFTKRS